MHRLAGRTVVMANRIAALTIDCADPELVAGFWAGVLGWQVVERYSYGLTIAPDAGGPLRIDLLAVPDGPKRGKNRLHLDLRPTDRDQDAELERLLALGAQHADIGQGEVSWYVLADPEGNEFCLLRERAEA